jgi:alpha-tubulin suppressor-like RCC1 family protein
VCHMPVPARGFKARLSCWTTRMVPLLLSVGCGDSVGPESSAPAPSIHAGGDFTCSVGTDGNVRCWGWNSVGQLGIGTTDDESVPTVIAGDLRYQSAGIDGSGSHACALTEDGRAYCWGANGFGELGNGTNDLSTVPEAVLGGFRFASISAGSRFTCAVEESGGIGCWGRGVWGQLGDGSTESSTVPVLVASDVQFISVEAGGSNACALSVTGDVFCWGLNWQGAVGRNAAETCTSGTFTLSCSTRPVMLPSPGGQPFTALSVGASFACGVLVDGGAYCWGSNTDRQLGVASDSVCVVEGFGDLTCSRTPLRVDVGRALTSITAGSTHACAVAEDGGAYCWGRNTYGQLGNGSFRDDHVPPRPVSGNLDFLSVSAGTSHSCGVTTAHDVYCWGINDHFQLGNDSTLIGERPVRVAIGPS